MEITQVFDLLVSTLGQILEEFGNKGKSFKDLSEDTICFLLANGFLNGGVRADAIQMEVRHPELKKYSETAVDVYVSCETGPFWIEVKFDKTLSDYNIGGVVNDLYRLGLINEGKSLMLYICPKEPPQTQDFLDANQFTLNRTFLSKLRVAARKRVKELVTQTLREKSVTVRLLRRAEVQSLLCRLYEVGGSA